MAASVSPLGARSGSARVVVAAVVALFLASFGLGATPADAAEGMTVDAHTTYRLLPKQGKVHVTVKAHLTNTMPARTQGAYISTPYFDSWAVPTLGPVRNARARSSRGGSLDVNIEKGKRGISGVVVDLEPNLVYGAPQTVTIDFDLPNQAPRSKSVTRVNKGFASWFVFGAGDRGDIDVTVKAPANFELALSKDVKYSDFREGDFNVIEMRNVRRYDDAILFASATNDDGIKGERLKVGDTNVTIKAWPGDTKWQRFATRWTKRGLPTLERLIGVDSLQDELTVAESSRSYQLGYAGFYVPSEGRVEVGDALDKTTVLHELSHVWFNRHLFTERWLGEGLAESYANRALRKLGEKPKPPKRIDIDDPARVPLNAWPPIAILDPKRAKVEAYAYNASYSVIEELIDEIGIDGMQKVIAAAANRELPYQGDQPSAEETQVARDWRYFFDLAEMVGGSKEIDSIFRDQVLTPEQEVLLPDRDEAHRKLQLLNEAGEGWSAPLEVREAVTAWEFGEASGLMKYATTLLDRSKATVDKLRAVDVDVATSLKTQYESASSLSEYDDSLERLERTTDEVVALRKRADGAGPVTRLGLVGSDLGIDQLNAAVADGELERVPGIVAAATKTLDRAPTRGAIILVALLLLVLIAVTVVLVRRRRRAKDTASAAGDDANRAHQDREIVLDDAQAGQEKVVGTDDNAEDPPLGAPH